MLLAEYMLVVISGKALTADGLIHAQFYNQSFTINASKTCIFTFYTDSRQKNESTRYVHRHFNCHYYV